MVYRGNNNANANGGVSYANANNDASNSNSNVGSRLENNESAYSRVDVSTMRSRGSQAPPKAAVWDGRKLFLAGKAENGVAGRVW